MNELLSFNEIQYLTNGSWLTPPENPDQKIRAAAFDTRKIGDAQIFFTFESEENDGHAYLQQLKNSNIRLIIVQKTVAPIGDIALLKTQDSLKALHKLARRLAAEFKGKIVTLTGSSGKTTAKNWLTHVLRSKYQVLTNSGSFNNHIGCPITILNMDSHDEIMVLEMGTSGLGELELLSSIAPADISILLNVGRAHIGKFGNRENIYRAKTEIFSNQKLSAISLIPFNDPGISRCLQNRRLHYFGKESPEFSWETEKIDTSLLGQYIRFETPWGKRSLFVNHLGDYVGELLSAVIATCFHLGLTWQDMESRFETLPQEKGRSKFVRLNNGALILDDTYNANPESTINMLRTICSLNADRTIAVIGNLAELEEGLSESAQFILENIPDQLSYLILSGDTGKILKPMIQKEIPKLQVMWFETTQEISGALAPLLGEGVVIGIKGSRSAHMERVLYALEGETTSCDLSRCGRLPMCKDCDQF